MPKAYLIVTTTQWTQGGEVTFHISERHYYVAHNEAFELDGNYAGGPSMFVTFQNDNILLANYSGTGLSLVDEVATKDLSADYVTQYMDEGETVFLESPTDDEGVTWQIYFKGFYEV